jgi:glycosyltransferase involved in cell wall biosynthesis
MSVRTVVVCETQVPFVKGGAESHAKELVHHLRRHGFETEQVALPFKWYPRQEILAHAAAWRLIDLSESNGRPIDLAIATKFPSYFVRHPHKVTWLLHQYRAAYELCGTPFSDFAHTEEDVGLRERLTTLDGQMLAESKRLFTIARNTAGRLKKFNNLDAEPLYHPPRLAGRLAPGPYGDYVLSVGRLETVKRVDLAIRAMALVRSPVRLLIAGNGTQRENLEALASELGIGDRVTFLGTIDDERLVEMYAGALAVVYAPFDEDYGYVTLEAFLAAKPVITARDSGGTLEFVEHGLNGVIADPEPAAIASAIDEFASNHGRARALGEAGCDRASTVTWDGVIERLVGS